MTLPATDLEMPVHISQGDDTEQVVPPPLGATKIVPLERLVGTIGLGPILLADNSVIPSKLIIMQQTKIKLFIFIIDSFLDEFHQ